MIQRAKRILIVTSVTAERDAVKRGLQEEQAIEIHVCGVGPAAAAAYTAKALASAQYDLVINMGIAGGFSGKAEIGSLVIADNIVAADLGAESSTGFLSLEQLGFGRTSISVDAKLLTDVKEALQQTDLTIYTGTILSVSTVTGTAATALEFAERIPQARAEAMEGFGVATAALLHQLPVLEIRAISNLVGPRERSLWRIDEALHSLSVASSALLEVFR